MRQTAETISGYTYASPEIPKSSISMQELEELKATAGFTDEDQRYLKLAGDVLADQTKQIVDHWRAGIIVSIPHLAKHSRSLEGEPIPEYLAKSNLRFQQWILDTCFRTYDQDWLNYQQEIAARHTSVRKNQVDGASSTPFVPLRHILTFVPVMNETIKPYLAAGGHSHEVIDKMHLAWCKSIQIQLALWSRFYADVTPQEW
jgi:hypothetical protein